MYTCTFHEADTLRERRHECGVRANTKRGSRNEIRNPFFANDKDKRQDYEGLLTSVVTIPVIGPMKMV
jgi:hypothetical protein